VIKLATNRYASVNAILWKRTFQQCGIEFYLLYVNSTKFQILSICKTVLIDQVSPVFVCFYGL